MGEERGWGKGGEEGERAGRARRKSAGDRRYDDDTPSASSGFSPLMSFTVTCFAISKGCHSSTCSYCSKCTPALELPFLVLTFVKHVSCAPPATCQRQTPCALLAPVHARSRLPVGTVASHLLGGEEQLGERGRRAPGSRRGARRRGRPSAG